MELKNSPVLMGMAHLGLFNKNEPDNQGRTNPTARNSLISIPKSIVFSA